MFHSNYLKYIEIKNFADWSELWITRALIDAEPSAFDHTAFDYVALSRFERVDECRVYRGLA